MQTARRASPAVAPRLSHRVMAAESQAVEYVLVLGSRLRVEGPTRTPPRMPDVLEQSAALCFASS